MSPDDIDSIVLNLHSFLVNNLNCDLDEDKDYSDLSDILHDLLEPFVTRDRNYN